MPRSFASRVMFLTGLALLLPGQPAVAQALPAGITLLRDVEFAVVDGISLRLDLYLPAGPGPHPVLVWVHGGGWQSGDKSLDSGSVQVRQAGRGYVVASVNYRLSGQAIFPAQIQDVKAAIRFLRANASRWAADPSRIGVWGGSAGGHLAALAGTSGDVAELEGVVGGNLQASSRVQAVVDWYGPSDLPDMPAQALPCSTDHSAPSAPEGRLLGCAIPACPETARRASPITYVSADDPPFHIVQGTADCTVPPLQSVTFDAALRASRVVSDLTMIPGAGHGGPEFSDSERLPALEAFLDRTLGTSGGATWFVPSTARVRGASGAFYQTHLDIANVGTARAAISLTFLGHDVDGRTGAQRSLSLDGGQSVAFRDLLGSVFGLAEGYGAIRVTADSPALVMATQTETAAPDGGTYGQSVPVFSSSDWIRSGSSAVILGVRQDDAFRTNLVLTNATEAPLDVDVALVLGDGTRQSSTRLTLPPLGMTQIGRVLETLGAPGGIQGARLVLSTPTASGAFVAYAALIDATTNDPRTLLPR